jgi:hypothetical protein
MCTDDLLSNLRCADCRQIQFERFYRFAAKAALVALSGVFSWMLARTSDGEAHHSKW